MNLWPFRTSDPSSPVSASFHLISRVVDNSRVALTILRIGRLSTPIPYRCNATRQRWPHTFTPDRQCLRRQLDFRFAIRPFSVEQEDQLLGESLLWAAEPIYGQMDPTVSYVEMGIATGTAIVCWKSIRRCFFPPANRPLDGQDLVLRLFNPTSRPMKATLPFFHD